MTAEVEAKGRSLLPQRAEDRAVRPRRGKAGLGCLGPGSGAAPPVSFYPIREYWRRIKPHLASEGGRELKIGAELRCHVATR